MGESAGEPTRDHHNISLCSSAFIHSCMNFFDSSLEQIVFSFPIQIAPLSSYFNEFPVPETASQMKPPPPLFLVLLIRLLAAAILSAPVSCLGSASTAAITYGTGTVCGIVAGEPTRRIQCYRNGLNIWVLPNVSFEAVSGGRVFFCGLMSGGFSILCWDTRTFSELCFLPKRIFFSRNVSLTGLAVGEDQVCAREVDSGTVRCWRGYGFSAPWSGLEFGKITSGVGFSCGILRENGSVSCWGSNNSGAEVETKFENMTMLSLNAGESHVCGLTNEGFLVCEGNNDFGQLNVASSNSAFEFSGLALGANFSCAIRRSNGRVVCWGRLGNGFESEYDSIKDLSFESIVAGLDFVCGLTTMNLSLVCWGSGWSNGVNDLPLGTIVPGPCVMTTCKCGVYLNSESLCDGSGYICRSCEIELPVAVQWPPRSSPDPQPVPPKWKDSHKLSLMLLIGGSVGVFGGLCSVLYCLWCGFLHKKIHNSVQPRVTNARLVSATNVDNDSSSALPNLRAFSIQSSRRWGCQRSGSSTSSKHAEKTQHFSLSQLAAATDNFSLENKIGTGSFGVVYKGKLPDGREVAIKRGETSAKVRKFQEQEIAFDSELVLLSRLHHKHLVGLVGFCQEDNERLLVYEYMSNGSLHDHLHNSNNIEKDSSILNSWSMRIKIALDAARGIEYLHNYAVPPIVHRDIKSSNMLLDANWTTRVSDFGLSLILGPEFDQGFMSSRAVGTVGYIDPEYFVLNVLTAKSDVYGFGVVLLELLTGKRAVFKNEVDGTSPIGVVEYATPQISAGEFRSVLDERVGLPEIHEAEALELLAYTALHCVNLDGKLRPNATDIVSSLERALALLEDSPARLSTTLSISSG